MANKICRKPRQKRICGKPLQANPWQEINTHSLLPLPRKQGFEQIAAIFEENCK